MLDALLFPIASWAPHGSLELDATTDDGNLPALVDCLFVLPLGRPHQFLFTVHRFSSLEHDVQSSYVHVKTATGWELRAVTTGEKNLFFVEILSGLEAGDIVALSLPEAS